MTDELCTARGESFAVPGHTHTCVGRHNEGDHYCGECRRWWWTK